MANNCINCKNCGHTGWSKPRGSILITLVLALFFILPAIAYEVWRRLGLGVCENCGGSNVAPSSTCTTQRPTDIGSMIILLILGVAGAFIVVLAYSFIDGAINGYPTGAKTTKDLEDQCVAQGLKYYQKVGQYPTLSNGEETSTHVLRGCRDSIDGKFKAP
ncbi:MULTISPECIES: Pmp3 family protein [unclassified Acinetobacter]|jgi:hypothetical protein|uniref:Pmp3 family protein n=1 Tax=unclassified Acinetobacter TaxID=196816 RepID=UPI0015D30EFA|nr:MULTISPECIES: Pmp3 family protein [unclassified Acinetobacter]